MLSVSNAFQEAIRQPRRQTSIRGTLYIRKNSGAESYDFDDRAVIQKSLVIKDQFPNGKFGYGGAYIRNLSIKLDCTKIDGLEPFNINLTSAEILLWFTLLLDDETPEEVFLGSFFINSKDSSRKFDILSLIGEDCLTKLDVTSVAMTNATPYQVCKRACELAGLSFGNTEEEIKAFPNGTLSLTFDTAQIQTARDMIMWAAKLTGTFVHAKRQVEPCVELVQIPKKYTARDGSADQEFYGNFDLDTFIADNGSIIPADLRRSSDYTDTSIRITGLMTDFQGERTTVKKPWTFAPDTLEGMMEVESNPLLNGKTASNIFSVITNLVDYTEELRFCPFEITFNGNPAVEVGDFVYLEPGGGIDDTTFKHYGIVTYYKWVYDGDCDIRCSSDVAAERPDSSTISLASIKGSPIATIAQSGEDVNSVAPKSQLEKRLQKTPNSTVSDMLEFLYPANNRKYVLKLNSTGLSAYSVDSNGGIIGGSFINDLFSAASEQFTIQTPYVMIRITKEEILIKNLSSGLQCAFYLDRIIFGRNHEIRCSNGDWFLDNKKVMLEGW